MTGREQGPIGEEVSPGRVGRDTVYDGRIVKLSLDTVRFPDGDTGTLELVSHAGASAIVPFLDAPTDPDPRIVLVHQYRYASGGYLYEVPAGIPDSEAEPWIDCARRELLEETGYSAGELRYLTRIYTTPGFTDEVIHLFAAHSLESGTASLDRDEYLDVVAVRLSRALEWIRDGKIIDAKSLVSILFVAQFLKRVWTEDRPSPGR